MSLDSQLDITNTIEYRTAMAMLSCDKDGTAVRDVKGKMNASFDRVGATAVESAQNTRASLAYLTVLQDYNAL